MSATHHQIDTLADRAKRLPEDRQRVIVEALREMLDEPYVCRMTSLRFSARRWPTRAPGPI